MNTSDLVKYRHKYISIRKPLDPELQGVIQYIYRAEDLEKYFCLGLSKYFKYLQKVN